MFERGGIRLVRREHELAVLQVDADDVPQTIALIGRVKPKIVINVALPYQDLHIMDACLAAGVDYVDTEPEAKAYLDKL